MRRPQHHHCSAVCHPTHTKATPRDNNGLLGVPAPSPLAATNDYAKAGSSGTLSIAATAAVIKQLPTDTKTADTTATATAPAPASNTAAVASKSHYHQSCRECQSTAAELPDQDPAARTLDFSDAEQAAARCT